MRKLIASLIIISTMTLSAAFANQPKEKTPGREWNDKSNQFSFVAELITADSELAVLSAKNDELVVVKRDELSDTDNEYLHAWAERQRRESEEEVEAAKTAAQDAEGSIPDQKRFDSKWTLRDGGEVAGWLAGYGSQTYVVNRERGKLFLGEQKLTDEVDAYQKIIPAVVAEADSVELKDASDLEEHIANRGGGPLKFRVEGVQIMLKSGETITIPVSLLSENESRLLMPSFARWQAAQKEDSSNNERVASSKVERLLLNAYHGNPTLKALKEERKLKYMQLSLLAAETGATNLWEVGLHSGRPFSYAYSIIVPAQNSAIAKQVAMRQYPGWKAIGVARLR